MFLLWAKVSFLCHLPFPQCLHTGFIGQFFQAADFLCVQFDLCCCPVWTAASSVALYCIRMGSISETFPFFIWPMHCSVICISQPASIRFWYMLPYVSLISAIFQSPSQTICNCQYYFITNCFKYQIHISNGFPYLKGINFHYSLLISHTRAQKAVNLFFRLTACICCPAGLLLSYLLSSKDR